MVFPPLPPHSHSTAPLVVVPSPQRRFHRSPAWTIVPYPLTPGPTLIGTQEALGVGPSSDALLFVICSPVGPYYPKGFKPVQLYATTEFVRAAPGGTGAYKLGAK